MPARRSGGRGLPKRKPEPWLAAKLAELDDTDGAVRIYLLVDELGAAAIARGILPNYIKRQARSALRPWSQWKVRNR
jgi:hypothetical protein